MKKIIPTFLVLIFSTIAFAQESPSNGFLLPRLTTAERAAMVNPAKGIVIYNTDTNAQEINTGTGVAPVWSPVATTTGAAAADTTTDAWEENAGNTVLNTGLVGIGTTNPQSIFHIASSNQDTPLMIENTSIGGRRWGVAAFGTIAGFGTGGLGFGDYTAGWRMFLDGNGNLGVGTTTPSAKLDINGNIVLDYQGSNYTHIRFGHDAHDMLISDNTDAKVYGGGYFFRVTDAGGSSTDALMINENGKIGIGVNPVSKLHVQVNTDDRITIESTADQNVGFHIAKNVSGGANNISWQLYNPGTTKDLRIYSNEAGDVVNINSNGTFNIFGKVGIGTNSPEAKLDVRGNGSNSIAAVLGVSNTMGLQVVTGDESIVNSMVGRIGMFYNGVSTTATNGYIDFNRGGSGTDGYLTFGSNSLDRMTIASNGFVGIGTTNPNAILTIEGSLTKVPHVAYNQTGIVTWMTGGNDVDNDYNFHIRYNAAPATMTLTTGRNVGIDTMTPAAKLDVNGYIKVGSSDAIGDATPQAGMIRFNTTTSKFQGYTGSAWEDLH